MKPRVAEQSDARPECSVGGTRRPVNQVMNDARFTSQKRVLRDGYNPLNKHPEAGFHQGFDRHNLYEYEQ